jgi:transposase
LIIVFVIMRACDLEALSVPVPHPAGLAIEHLDTAGRLVRVLARTCASDAACPGCGVVSRRVHSRYQRKLADTASGGQEVLIHPRARRFFYSNDACAKATFAEQVRPDRPL